MSPVAVTTVGCLALVAALGAAAWSTVQHRRMSELERSLTARKWDIVTLRAELGALRRQLGHERPDARPGTVGDEPDVPCAEPESRATDGRSRTSAGPTAAWRRDRARSAATTHRRRRPS